MSSPIKEITPTDMFKQIARKLDETLETIIQIDEPTVETKLKEIDIDEDAAFEFMEQFDTCKEWMEAGYRINFVKSTGNDVETDKLTLALPVDFDPPFVPETKSKQQPVALPKPSIEKKNDALYTFDDVMAKISPEGRDKLKAENLLLEVVLARVTNQEIDDLNLSHSDLVILRQVVIQCRYHEHTRGGTDALITSIKSHSLNQKFPFSCPATFDALHQFGVKSANELYLYTSISRLHVLFETSQIVKEDQQAIMAGVGLAQYARNIARQNKRRIMSRK